MNYFIKIASMAIFFTTISLYGNIDLANKVQKLLQSDGFDSVVRKKNIDLCDSYYFLPYKLCKEKMLTNTILISNKISMRKHGIVGDRASGILRELGFKRNEKSVHTYDDGLYFYRCEEYFNKNTSITIHKMGINEHPSVGWFFRVILSSSKCQISSKYRGIGY